MDHNNIGRRPATPSLLNATRSPRVHIHAAASSLQSLSLA
jgi:hypothetical protein